MFGFGARKPAPAGPDRARVVGLDLTSTRARAVALAAGKARPLLLDGPHEDLPLAVLVDRRPPAVGAAAVAVRRKVPHLVGANFLPQLGHPARRAAVGPADALGLVFEAVRGPVAAETDAVGLALPGYLTAAQVRVALGVAATAGLPVRGSAAAPLAVAAHRAGAVLGGPADPPAAGPDARPDWVVPMRAPPAGPAAVVVVDADDWAVTATAVGVDAREVKSLAAAARPRAAVAAWKDRLVDALADRCVRVCRRDPRDSADAEQALYDQLDGALDRARAGHPVTVAVRGAHWYQDLVQRPDELAGACGALAREAAAGVAEAVRAADLPVPPRAVWLTHAAARLPGLAAAVHAATPEQTEVVALPPNAAADAAAFLVPFWLTGMLPPVHLDAAIPLVGARAALGPATVSREAPPRSAAPRG